jgi:predicted RNase H-like HicB family nuclease
LLSILQDWVDFWQHSYIICIIIINKTSKGIFMKAEFTAIIETATEGGYWAICPEVPGANGQGETIEEAKESLKSAIQLIFEDRLADIRRGLSKEAIEETISIP